MGKDSKSALGSMRDDQNSLQTKAQRIKQAKKDEKARLAKLPKESKEE